MKISGIILTILVTISIFGMENDRIIKLSGDHSVISLKESDVKLMKGLYQHCRQHQTTIQKGGIISRYPHASSEDIVLVYNAMNVRPDKFKEFYDTLSLKKRTALINTSGQYNDQGKKVMLDVPEVTKRLIDVYFTDDGLRNHIKKYIGNDDEDYVRNYFKEKLICNKNMLVLKEPRFYDDVLLIREHIYLGSFFIDAVNTIDQRNYPIFLRIGNETHQTYATYFGIDNYEYRITDLADKQCVLWVINHDNVDDTFSTVIKHKRPIKGCRFGSTGIDVEYVLTYSKHDIVLSTITTQNGIAFIESKVVNAPDRSSIVDVCFDSVNDDWVVVLYRGRKSIFKRLNKEGCFSLQGNYSQFKNEGLVERIISYQQDSDCGFNVIFGVGNQCSVEEFKTLGTGDSVRISFMGFMNRSASYEMIHSFKVNGFSFIFNYAHPFFIDFDIQQKNEQNGSFLHNIWDYFSSKSMSKIHRVYSPDGSFLMCNSLKSKLGMLYVETVIRDALTHKKILFIDTLYKNFKGVGFTHDGTELIFISQIRPHYIVSLLDGNDKKMLQEIHSLVFNNLGVTALLKRLCENCREKGVISLQTDDLTYAMLLDWSKKSPTMLEFLKKCLPIQAIKK